MRGGRLIETAVPLVLPIAGGAVAALSAAMAGPALAPAALVLALSMTFFVARTGGGAAHVGRRVDRRVRHLFLAVAAALATLLVALLAEPTPLTRMTRDELHTAFRDDVQLYGSMDHGVDAVLSHVEDSGADVLGADDERALADSWRALVDHVVALESLRRFYDQYYLLDVSARREEHALAFLLTYAADVTIYHAASRFTQRVVANDNAKKFLDAPRGTQPAGSFSRFREDLLGTSAEVRIAAGEGYLHAVTRMVGGPLSKESEYLIERIHHHLAGIGELPRLERTEQTYRAELQRVKRGAVRAWYPLQAKVAELLGDTRVRRPGRYLIDHDLREHVDAKLEPGDILLSRKNWYLSNIGLPGFWPHAMLYIGDPDKLDAYFGEDDVKLGSKMSERLASRYPDAWRAYSENHGEPTRVIEAVSEGVVFSTLEHCAGDYFAAMRPRLGKLDKAAAIEFAFSQFQKPYDFDFDFATDHALVCTELVWRSYRPAADRKAGLDFQLVSVAGRMTLPANELVAKYAHEAGTPDAQLDFVLFVDAREDVAQAFESTEEAFRASALRTKWDIAQE